MRAVLLKAQHNPYTGGVSTGSLIGCQDASKSSGGRITVLSGSVSLGRNVGIRRMTTKRVAVVYSIRVLGNRGSQF